MHRPGLLDKLAPELLADITNLAQTLRSGGYECYLVGGAVRDLLLNRPMGDLDFTTNAKPEEVQKLFKRTVPTGIEHGTMTVLLGDRAYEVTTYRSESTYSDARRPDRITFAKTLSEDLTRRDFTVNALAFDPVAENLIDEHNGLDDLKSKVIRTIGNPKERFSEDGLRTVRACRFASVLGFSIEEKTKSALSDAEIQKRTSMVAVERFTDELLKGMNGPEVSLLIELLEETGLMQLFVILPGKTKPETLTALDRITLPTNRLGLWLSHFYDGPAEKEIENIGRKIKLSHKHIHESQWIDRILRFTAKNMAASQANNPQEKGQAPLDLAAKRRFCAGIKKAFPEPATWLSRLVELDAIEPGLRQIIDQFYGFLKTDPLLPTDLALNGTQIAALGFSGKAIGDAISYLLGAVYLDPAINTKSGLEQLLQSAPKSISKI